MGRRFLRFTAGSIRSMAQLGPICSDQSVAAPHYRPDSEAGAAEIAESWWSWYLLMDCSVEMLRQHRDEQQRFWEANQHNSDAWTRLVRYNELLVSAKHGEYEAETN
jgi:hypothetical protein